MSRLLSMYMGPKILKGARPHAPSVADNIPWLSQKKFDWVPLLMSSCRRWPIPIQGNGAYDTSSPRSFDEGPFPVSVPVTL